MNLYKTAFLRHFQQKGGELREKEERDERREEGEEKGEILDESVGNHVEIELHQEQE